MPPAPCTNADVSAAIRAHTRPSKSGSKGRHADSVAATSNNADIAEGFEKEKGMERSAMIKRLKIILYVVVKHEAFERYSDNCTHASDLGAFHDCPVGTDPGSLTSKSASYTSNQSHRELLECLADAVREHWICLRKGSPRWSTLCDETSEVSGKSQNAIAVKKILPSGKTAVPFAGLHEMPRSTANHLLNALVHQVPTPVPTPTAPMPCLHLCLQLQKLLLLYWNYFYCYLKYLCWCLNHLYPCPGAAEGAGWIHRGGTATGFERF